MRGAGSSGGRASPAGPHPHSGRALRPQHGTGPLSSWSPGPSGAHTGPRGCPPEHGRVTWAAIRLCLGSVGTGAISPTRVAPVGVPRGWAVTGSGERAGPQVWGLGSRTPGLSPAASSLCPQCWGSGSSAGAHPAPMLNHSHPGPPPWALGPGDRPALASLLTAAEATGPAVRGVQEFFHAFVQVCSGPRTSRGWSCLPGAQGSMRVPQTLQPESQGHFRAPDQVRVGHPLQPGID